MRLLLVGDIAGHLSALDEILGSFGVSVMDAAVPVDAVVVQVGDLVGRSPESDDLVARVERIRERSPDRWVQLAGNHELHHLGGHQFQGTIELSATTINTMRSWLDEGWLRIAVAFGDARSQVLVTHAGLTRGLWRELGEPTRADDAADALEALRRTRDGWEAINRAGRMLNLGRFPIAAANAGPIWAEAGVELLPDWIVHRDLPFDQVHGHSSAFDWFRGRLRNPDIADHCDIDRASRHVVVRSGDHTVTGIDPGLGRDGHARWSPLVLALEA